MENLDKYFGNDLNQELDVSIVSVTMNRHTNLICAIHTWFELPVKEIIIIDWCSNIKFESIIPTYLKYNPNYKKIKIFRVEGYDRWVLTWAFNLGISLASSEYILKLDADILVDKYFFNINPITDNLFYRGKHEITRTYYLDGQLFIKKEYIEKIGYYNEKIITYGCDDYDLYKRLDKIGLKYNLIQGISHTHQEQFTRNENQDIDNLKIEIEKNKNLSDNNIFEAFNPLRYERKNNLFLFKDTNTGIENKKEYVFNGERFIVLKLFGNIRKRIQTLITTSCFAKEHNYKMYVIWNNEDCYNNSDFFDFFNYEKINFSFISNDYMLKTNFDYKKTLKSEHKFFDTKYNKIYIEGSESICILLRIFLPNHYSYYKNLKLSDKLQNIKRYIENNIINKYKYNIFYLEDDHKNSIDNIIKLLNQTIHKNIIICDNYDDYCYYDQKLNILCKDKYTFINTNDSIPLYTVINFYLFENAINIYGGNYLNLVDCNFGKNIINIY